MTFHRQGSLKPDPEYSALGHGVGGDPSEDLLNHAQKRADHLVYFNPGDLEFLIGSKFIGSVALDERNLVASGMVGECRPFTLQN